MSSLDEILKNADVIQDKSQQEQPKTVSKPKVKMEDFKSLADSSGLSAWLKKDITTKNPTKFSGTDEYVNQSVKGASVGAGIGAGIGAFGGPLGALAGAGTGAVTGAISSIASQGVHDLGLGETAQFAAGMVGPSVMGKAGGALGRAAMKSPLVENSVNAVTTGAKNIADTAGHIASHVPGVRSVMTTLGSIAKQNTETKVEKGIAKRFQGTQGSLNQLGEWVKDKAAKEIETVNNQFKQAEYTAKQKYQEAVDLIDQKKAEITGTLANIGNQIKSVPSKVAEQFTPQIKSLQKELTDTLHMNQGKKTDILSKIGQLEAQKEQAVLQTSEKLKQARVQTQKQLEEVNRAQAAKQQAHRENIKALRAQQSKARVAAQEYAASHAAALSNLKSPVHPSELGSNITEDLALRKQALETDINKTYGENLANITEAADAKGFFNESQAGKETINKLKEKLPKEETGNLIREVSSEPEKIIRSIVSDLGHGKLKIGANIEILRKLGQVYEKGSSEGYAAIPDNVRKEMYQTLRKGLNDYVDGLEGLNAEYKQALKVTEPFKTGAVNEVTQLSNEVRSEFANDPQKAADKLFASQTSVSQLKRALDNPERFTEYANQYVANKLHSFEGNPDKIKSWLNKPETKEILEEAGIPDAGKDFLQNVVDIIGKQSAATQGSEKFGEKLARKNIINKDAEIGQGAAATRKSLSAGLQKRGSDIQKSTKESIKSLDGQIKDHQQEISKLESELKDAETKFHKEERMVGKEINKQSKQEIEDLKEKMSLKKEELKSLNTANEDAALKESISAAKEQATTRHKQIMDAVNSDHTPVSVVESMFRSTNMKDMKTFGALLDNTGKEKVVEASREFLANSTPATLRKNWSKLKDVLTHGEMVDKSTIDKIEKEVTEVLKPVEHTITKKQINTSSARIAALITTSYYGTQEQGDDE